MLVPQPSDPALDITAASDFDFKIKNLFIRKFRPFAY